MSNEYFSASTNGVLRVGWYSSEHHDDFARTPGKPEDGIDHPVRIELGEQDDCWLTAEQTAELATALLQMASELRDAANNIPARDE